MARYHDIITASSEDDLREKLQKYELALVNRREGGFVAIPYSVDRTTHKFNELSTDKLWKNRLYPWEGSIYRQGEEVGPFCLECNRFLLCEATPGGRRASNCEIVSSKYAQVRPVAKASKNRGVVTLRPKDVESTRDLALVLQLQHYWITWAYTTLLTPIAERSGRFVDSSKPKDGGRAYLLRYKAFDSGQIDTYSLPRSVGWSTTVHKGVGVSPGAIRFGAPYTSLKIKKRGGGYRQIFAPNNYLKKIQKAVLKYLLNPVVLPDYVTAFNPRSGIVQNAQTHAGKDVVISLDLRNFFDSVGAGKIFKVFRALGYADPICHILTTLTTWKKRLVQGPPTSPALANMAALGLDRALIKICAAYDFTYTRYADDLTFSGNRKSRRVVDKLIQIATEIAASHGFAVHTEKTKVFRKPRGQIVTGLLVNNGVKLRPAWKKQTEHVLYLLEKGASVTETLPQIQGALSFAGQVEPAIQAGWQQRLDKILQDPAAHLRFGVKKQNREVLHGT